MKNIQNWETFNESQMNESWRQVKAWLKIPQILFEELLHKLIKFVPRIGIRYDKLAAKIDTGSSNSASIIKDEPIKLTIDDIKNETLRKTLKLTGIFDKWNIYTFDRTHENRQPIYITKDELKIGDEYCGERISDWQVDDMYSPKNARKLKKQTGGKVMSELEPQFWVVCALKTEEHDEMSKEREERYSNKKTKSLEKAVANAIKEDRILSRSSYFDGEWNNDPIAFKVARSGRVDLMQKLIDACDEEDRVEMLNTLIDNDGWDAPKQYKGSYGYKIPLDVAKTEEMKKLIQDNM